MRHWTLLVRRNPTQICLMNKKHNSGTFAVLPLTVSPLSCPSRLREGVRKMEEKHFAEHIDEHVEFLPVEWRSKLSLDGGGFGIFFNGCLFYFWFCLCGAHI